MSNVAFNYYAPEEPVGILSVVPGYLSLRVNFTDAMLDDSELRDPDNYTITAIDAAPTTQIHNSDVLDVTPENVANPTYVVLTCTDLTHGKEYRLTITPDRLSSQLSVKLVSANTADYTGVSLIPSVQTVRPVSDTIMEVIFTKEMTPTEGLVDPTSYSFDKGLEVREVLVIAPGTVHLVTTRQTPSELYTLTVS